MRKFVIITVLGFILGSLPEIINPFIFFSREWWLFCLVINGGIGIAIVWNTYRIDIIIQKLTQRIWK